MDLVQAIILAVVQGLSEFLPISSSGHLILIPHFFGWQDQGMAFDVALHVGTLIAVVAYFRRPLMADRFPLRFWWRWHRVGPQKFSARRTYLCNDMPLVWH